MDERERNKELIEKYPFLMPYNIWTGEPIEDYFYEYTWLDDMPDGWRNAFGLQMCEDLKNALLEEGGEKLLSEYRIDQIKEKFGYLRWYDNWTTKKVQDIIRKYEDLSARTCISCGKPATKISRGWICPWCDDCASKKLEDYIPISEFYDEK